MTDRSILLFHGFHCIGWVTKDHSYHLPYIWCVLFLWLHSQVFFIFDFQSFFKSCLDMSFFVFTLLEVTWLLDLWVNVFHEFWKSTSYYSSIFFHSFSLFLLGFQFKDNRTEISYSVIVLLVFQVRKFLLSCVWLCSLILSFRCQITVKSMKRIIHLQCSSFHFWHLHLILFHSVYISAEIPHLFIYVVYLFK